MYNKYIESYNFLGDYFHNSLLPQVLIIDR